MADSHHAASRTAGTTVALMSYNVGIQNKEIVDKHWKPKYEKLKADVQKVFDHEAGMQIMLIS